jgi:hypothetical protein
MQRRDSAVQMTPDSAEIKGMILWCLSKNVFRQMRMEC